MPDPTNHLTAAITAMALAAAEDTPSEQRHSYGVAAAFHAQVATAQAMTRIADRLEGMTRDVGPESQPRYALRVIS